MKRLCIFASGGGSNAAKIIEYFQGHPSIEVALIISNRKKAGVLQIAREADISAAVPTRSSFYEDPDGTLLLLDQHQIDFIALAGFLWLVPSYLVQAYSDRIFNIHPALLPKYGGPGMYGKHVHQAVYDAGEDKSGMTIHYVNEHYDEGAIVFQATTPIDAEDLPDDIARKVLLLEHRHYAAVIEAEMLKD